MFIRRSLLTHQLSSSDTPSSASFHPALFEASMLFSPVACLFVPLRPCRSDRPGWSGPPRHHYSPTPVRMLPTVFLPAQTDVRSCYWSITYYCTSLDHWENPGPPTGACRSVLWFSHAAVHTLPNSGQAGSQVNKTARTTKHIWTCDAFRLYGKNSGTISRIHCYRCVWLRWQNRPNTDEMLQTSAARSSGDTSICIKAHSYRQYSAKKCRSCQCPSFVSRFCFSACLDQTLPSGSHAMLSDISGLQTVPGGSWYRPWKWPWAKANHAWHCAHGEFGQQMQRQQWPYPQ